MYRYYLKTEEIIEIIKDLNIINEFKDKNSFILQKLILNSINIFNTKFYVEHIKIQKKLFYLFSIDNEILEEKEFEILWEVFVLQNIKEKDNFYLDTDNFRKSFKKYFQKNLSIHLDSFLLMCFDLGIFRIHDFEKVIKFSLSKIKTKFNLLLRYINENFNIIEQKINEHSIFSKVFKNLKFKKMSENFLEYVLFFRIINHYIFEFERLFFK